MNNPRVSRKTTTEQYVRFAFPEVAEFVIPLLNKLEPRDLSDAKEKMEAGTLFSTFKKDYIPAMNAVRDSFLEHTFSSLDEAIQALNLVVRSFVCGFCVHRKTTYKLKNNTSKTLIQCHTRHHKKGQKSVDSCRWSAHIECKGGIFRYTDIADFSLHSFDCFCHDSRLTPNEVLLRFKVPSNQLHGFLNKFKQCRFAKKAIYQRRYQQCSMVEELIDEDFLQSLEGQEVLDSISNISEFPAAKPTEDVTLILRYLSSLRVKEELEAFVTFAQSDALTRIEVSSIDMMWKEGKSLLKTHSDVIFCDSMWNVSINGYFVLTIVVVDENYDIRLAALSLVQKERKCSWKSFFEWVKKTVPEFRPKCVVTDGACYIDDGFTEAIGLARSIVCWWHQRENVMKKIHLSHKKGCIFLKITYAETAKKKKKLEEQARELAKNDVKIAASRRFEEMLKNCSKNALISLTIFTGGTVTNSYSESINSLLRKAGCTIKFSMKTVLQNLVSFLIQHNCREKYHFSPCEELELVIGDDVIRRVTSGALCHFQRIIQRTIKCCEILESDGKNAVLRDSKFILCRVDVEYHRRHRISWRPKRKRKQWKRSLVQVKRCVDWSGSVPKCSCNVPRYSGIPCVHIVQFARFEQKKIPVTCFNPRFYYDSRVPATFSPIEQTESEIREDDDKEETPEMPEMPEVSEMQDEENEDGDETFSDCKLVLEKADEISFLS